MYQIIFCVMNKRNAWIFGATGLIGGHLVELISQKENYEHIHVFSRRELTFSHPKVIVHIIDFKNLESELETIEVGDLFCCLGTTMKIAGSKEAFRFVDHHLPVEIARIGFAKGAKRFLMISAMGADSKSMIFYNQVKGETEEDIQQYDFEQIAILQPSLLLGERDEARMGEKIGEIVMNVLSPIMVGPMKKYKAIEGETVAKAMLNIAFAEPEQRIFNSEELEKWGNKN